jgi:hypothetical protein
MGFREGGQMHKWRTGNENGALLVRGMEVE